MEKRGKWPRQRVKEQSKRNWSEGGISNLGNEKNRGKGEKGGDRKQKNGKYREEKAGIGRKCENIKDKEKEKINTGKR